MNNKPVEQALATLLPTHANDLPPELLSLSLSLVAQSRSFSSSLRPEEDIARPYACAEIACKKLTRALKLPPLMGHPPCPPRVYKKLYSFLDRSLSSNIASPRRSGSLSAPGTPSRAGTGPSTPTKTSRVVRTPSKTTTRDLQNTPTKSTPLKTSTNNTSTPQKQPTFRPHGLSASTIIPDAPSWVMNSIRNVCKTLSTPAPRTNTWSRPPISRTLPPHIFAGVSSILYFISDAVGNGGTEDLDEELLEFLEPVTLVKDKDRDTDEDYKELVNALVVAVYFLVLARRRAPAEGAGTEGVNQKMDKKTFMEMRQTALVSIGLPPTERRHRDDVDQWIALVMEQGWARGKEWFENIPPAGEVDGDQAYFSDEGGEEYGGDRQSKRPKTMMTGRGSLFGSSSRKGLLPGLGTMMQDRVDWLSDDRREDYIEWKSDVMAQIAQMERAAV